MRHQTCWQMAQRDFGIELNSWDDKLDTYLIRIVGKHPAIWIPSTDFAKANAWLGIKEDITLNDYNIDLLKNRWEVLYKNYKDSVNSGKTGKYIELFAFINEYASDASTSASSFTSPKRRRTLDRDTTPENGFFDELIDKITKLMRTHSSTAMTTLGEIHALLDARQIEAEKKRQESEKKRIELEEESVRLQERIIAIQKSRKVPFVMNLECVNNMEGAGPSNDAVRLRVVDWLRSQNQENKMN